jgi:O-antigen ligase
LDELNRFQTPSNEQRYQKYIQRRNMLGSSARNSSETIFLYGLLICAFPFGVAVQNVALCLFALLAMGFRLYSPVKHRLSSISPMHYFIGTFLTFLLWNVIATWLSPSQQASEPFANLVGYLPIIVLPYLITWLPRLNEDGERRLLTLSALVVCVWGLVVLSQYLYPWKIVGTSVVSNWTERAQGLYSHPMSLAYASLILWPLSLRTVISFPKVWQGWVLMLGTVFLLFFSMSRIVQILAVLFTLWNIWIVLSGRQRLISMSIFAILITAIAVTKNPVSSRFHRLTNPTPDEVLSDYPDDRLAFWHAHALMVQDRPLLGHGVNLNLEFRRPYYEALGLGSFIKKYPAHNQYLQIAAESGLIGLFLYGLWLVAAWNLIQKYLKQAFFRITAQQTLLIFILGCITQNAFGDSCVRMGLVILFCLGMVKAPRESYIRSGYGLRKSLAS